MDRLPADVLIPIFKQYLSEKSTMPILLTKVCRHWYNIITGTPSLWFRVVINVKNRDTIPSILSSDRLNSFESYLARTDTDTNGREGYDEILLEIEIRCQKPSDMEHNPICSTPLIGRWGREHRCTYALERRDQLDELFAYFVDSISSASNTRDSESALGVHEYNLRCKNMGKSRIARFKSLVVKWDDVLTKGTDTRDDPRTDIFSSPSVIAPRLTYLSLDAVTPWHMPHKNFAPNLTSLSILNTKMAHPMNLPHLKSLTIGGRIRSWGYSGKGGNAATYETVEELHVKIDEWVRKLKCPKLPNLKRLMIYQMYHFPWRSTSIEYIIYNASNKLAIGENKKLEEVHFIDVQDPALMGLLNNSLIKSAHKVVLHNPPKLESGTPEEIEAMVEARQKIMEGA